MTIGGYDASLFVDNGLPNFPFVPDTSRELTISLQSIGFDAENGTVQLLTEPILSYVDPGTSHMWLPIDACALFEQAFNLTYNATLDRYFVDNRTRDSLLTENVSLYFHVASTASNGSVQIAMPYSALDLELKNYPGVNGAISSDSLPYFPLRRASNSSQYTLGRSFLQGAYLITDYERSKFSVHQALFPEAQTPKDIRAILPLSGSITSSTTGAQSPSPSNTLSTGALVGIAIGAALGLLVFCLAFFLLRRRRGAHLTGSKKHATPNEVDGTQKLELPAPDAGVAGLYIGELHNKSTATPELESGKRVPRVEMDASEIQGFAELSGTEAGHELGSEK